MEGYGRKRYKADFIKYLTYSHASNLETLCHYEKIQFLYPNFENEIKPLQNDYDVLGAKIFNFIKYVESNWNKFE